MAACSVGTILQPTRDPSQFYVLTPMDASARGVPITYSGTGGPRELEIGLGPVKFPAYLARAEIVTRSSPNKVDFSEIDRWAEPLDKNFVSVLSQNLTMLLGAHVITFPWYRPAKLDYQITLEITRFDTDSNGAAQVVGRWEIKDPEHRRCSELGRIEFHRAGALGRDSGRDLEPSARRPKRATRRRHPRHQASATTASNL